MARTEPWRWSATRVEIDQRSREARLRLEHAERLLMRRLLAKRSWLLQILNWLGLPPFSGRQIDEGCCQPPAVPPIAPCPDGGPRRGEGISRRAGRRDRQHRAQAERRLGLRRRPERSPSCCTAALAAPAGTGEAKGGCRSAVQ